MHSQADKCVCIIYTRSFAWHVYVPSSCSLIFLFHWPDTGKTRKGEFEGGMAVCFKEELKGRHHLSISQLFVYLGMFLLSEWSLLLLVWTRYNTKHSQTLGKGGSSATAIFSIQQFTSWDNNTGECLRSVRLKAAQQTATWQPYWWWRLDYFWLSVVV